MRWFGSSMKWHAENARGDDCYRIGDYVQAAKIWERSSQEGNDYALLAFGWCHAKGKGVSQDANMAASYYKKSVARGNAHAMRYLGSCYQFGAGVKKNANEAVRLYRQAIKHNDALAILNLGRCYETGSGVERDGSKAFELYQQALDKRCGVAILNVGWCYANGTGVEKDVDRATELYRVAVETRVGVGDDGHRPTFQVGTGEDERPIEQLCQQANDQDNAQAMAALGFILLMGYLVKRNLDKALELTRGAANLGEIYAIGNLALCVRAGVGSTEPVEESLFYARKGVAAGDTAFSTFLLADTLSTSASWKDLEEAKRLLRDIPQDYFLRERAKWLQIFLEDHIPRLRHSSLGQLKPQPDFVMDLHIKIVALIGEGQYGKVYLAHHAEYGWVAIKFVSVDLVSQSTEAVGDSLVERFYWRIIASKKIPNVARYIGCVDDIFERSTKGSQRVGLVFELCADISEVEAEAEERLNSGEAKLSRYTDLEEVPDWKKNVYSNLRTNVVFSPRPLFEPRKLIQMAIKLATAVNSLHALGFIHRDIAPRNCLCDGEGNVEVTDLGLSKFVGTSAGASDHDGGRLSRYKKTPVEGKQYAVSWMAPESVDGPENKPGVFSTESDVYSFGILLWQIFALKDPFHEMQPKTSQPEERRVAALKIMESIGLGQRPALEEMENAPDRLKLLIDRCWETDPELRPTMKEIISELKSILSEHGTSARNVVTIRSSRECKEKWDVVHAIYLERFHKESLNPIAVRNTPTSYGVQSRIDFVVSRRHSASPASAEFEKLPEHVKNQFRFLPTDVFLINTTPQKFVEAEVMDKILKQGGMNICFDLEFNEDSGPPREKMRSQIATCRYAVAIVSKELLQKRHPCEELQFAFQRMEWIRQQFGWESLRVILYDMTVVEYERARKKSRYRAILPDLTRRKVVTEWSKDGKGPMSAWSNQCHAYKDSLITSDERGAVDKWRKFLHGVGEQDNLGFPKADHLYGEAHEVTTTCTQWCSCLLGKSGDKRDL